MQLQKGANIHKKINQTIIITRKMSAFGRLYLERKSIKDKSVQSSKLMIDKKIPKSIKDKKVHSSKLTTGKQKIQNL